MVSQANRRLVRFRWVQCQLDRLGDCHLQGDIRKVLRTLPSGLYETYDQILSDVDGKEFNRQIVKSTLRWLVGALHPLELPALAEAVTFDLENSGVFGEALLGLRKPRLFQWNQLLELGLCVAITF